MGTRNPAPPQNPVPLPKKSLCNPRDRLWVCIPSPSLLRAFIRGFVCLFIRSSGRTLSFVLVSVFRLFIGSSVRSPVPSFVRPFAVDFRITADSRIPLLGEMQPLAVFILPGQSNVSTQNSSNQNSPAPNIRDSHSPLRSPVTPSKSAPGYMQPTKSSVTPKGGTPRTRKKSDMKKRWSYAHPQPITMRFIIMAAILAA